MWPELESVYTHKALLCSTVEDTMMCSKERERGREGQHFLEVGEGVRLDCMFPCMYVCVSVCACVYVCVFEPV